MRIKAFLDTNILMDIVQEGRLSTDASRQIMQAILDRGIEAVVTTQSIVDVSYIMQKAGMAPAYFQSVTKWLDYINVESVYTLDLLWAIGHYSGDFEDDALLSRALDTYCDVFVTNDKKLCRRNNGKYESLQFMTQIGRAHV